MANNHFMNTRITLTDDRGRPHAAWGSERIRWSRLDKNRLSHEVIRAISQDCQRHIDSQWRDQDAATLHATIESEWNPPPKSNFWKNAQRGAPWIIVAISLSVYLTTRINVLSMVSLVLVVSALLFTTDPFPRVPFRIRANAFLNRRLCPACGSSLNNIAAEPDDCTVCPECGAAWKLPVPTAEPGT